METNETKMSGDTLSIATEAYQVNVVNISYSKILNDKIKNRPTETVIDIPERIIKCKDAVKRTDNIESFVYDTLTKRYGAEVAFCQIYLPMK